MRDLADGDVLEVTADDPAFKLDIEAWCRRTGNTLLDLDKEGNMFKAHIRKVG